MKTIVAVILTLLLAGAAQAEELVYVRSLKADIYEEPSFAARQVATFAKGAEMVKLGEEKRWYRVQYREVTGWVAKLLVSDRPASAGKGAIKADTEIGTSARRRASAVATAGAARGLAPDDRRRLSADNTTDYSALSYMEGIAPPEAEVVEFLRKGMRQ
ncbi:MAG: SH3 domain-containing protein [Desulfurivibrionaceae bacterium]|nr:SH3 domain-containing protein [Desulfurivibrionaceae bacterium]